MSAKDATPQEIQAMKDRLGQKWSDRWNEAHMDDAVKMACRANRAPFVEARLASQDVEIARNPILRGQLNPSKFWRFP